jgi:hypothetical protein
MAPFNKRQIGYIKAIANVDAHNSYVYNVVGQGVNLPPPAAYVALSDPSIRQKFWTLGRVPLTYGVGPTPTESVDAQKTAIDVYNCPVYASTPDDRAAGKANRISAECFLESVNVKMRMIQPLDVDSDTKSHQEYRMMIFRHKERQSHIKQLAQNFSDPQYDVFVNGDGYKFGPKGYRQEVTDPSAVLKYTDHAGYSPSMDAQSIMTCHTNKSDYVFMKDCRFYLGKEYGGKHIFETKVHFEHQDPIATDLDDLSTTDNDKNYVWYIWIGCVTNAASGAASVAPEFPYTRFDTTTHVTSG